MYVFSFGSCRSGPNAQCRGLRYSSVEWAVGEIQIQQQFLRTAQEGKTKADIARHRAFSKILQYCLSCWRKGPFGKTQDGQAVFGCSMPL